MLVNDWQETEAGSQKSEVGIDPQAGAFDFFDLFDFFDTLTFFDFFDPFDFSTPHNNQQQPLNSIFGVTGRSENSFDVK